jgi:hypothetical protein
MVAHVQRNELCTVYLSNFRHHHSTTAAVLKVTEDIRSNMEDGHETKMVLFLRHLIWLYMDCYCVS